MAVPVAPWETARAIATQVDEFVCLHSDRSFLGGVSAYYDAFPQLSDDEVIRLLRESRGGREPTSRS